MGPPAKPTGFEAHAGDAQVTLQWDNPGNRSITRWEYKQGNGNWTTVPNSSASTTMHTVGSLNNGTPYTFKVRAVNASPQDSGIGAASDAASATPLAVPGQPTSLRATGGNARVALEWTTPSGAVTGWEVRVRAVGNSWGPWKSITASASGTTRTYTVMDTGIVIDGTAVPLDNNQTYAFQVRATNASGAGTPSGVASAVPVASAPSKPVNLSANATGVTVKLAWAYSPPIRHYVAKWQYSSDNGQTWADIPDGGGYKECRLQGNNPNLPAICSNISTPGVGGNIHTRYVTVTTQSSAQRPNLADGAVYYFKVRGVNDAGPGSASSAASVGTRPLAPTLTAMAGDEEVVLDWAKDSGDGTTITVWQYRYKTTGNYGGWITVPAATDATRAYTVTGLDNGTDYTFKARAVNTAGPGAESAESSARPKIHRPDKPTGLTATIGHTEVLLSWGNPYNNRITRYRYSTDNGANWTDVPNSGASTTEYIVPNLVNGTAYTFRVHAVTSAGAGPASKAITATPKAVPDPPTSLSATPGDSGEIDLTWTANSSATDWEIRYKLENGGYGSWTDICDSNCTAGTLAAHSVTGLHNNILYIFQVRGAEQHRLGAACDGHSALRYGRAHRANAHDGRRRRREGHADVDLRRVEMGG